MIISIHSLKNQAVIADKCIVADSFWVRLRGLIGKKHFDEGQGVFFPACNNIHMWWMGMSIDVVFVSDHRVTSVHEGVRAWKFFPLWDRKASETIELPLGTIRRCAIGEGDRLEYV